MPLPKLTRVRQAFDTTRLEDAAAAVATGLLIEAAWKSVALSTGTAPPASSTP